VSPAELAAMTPARIVSMRGLFHPGWVVRVGTRIAKVRAGPASSLRIVPTPSGAGGFERADSPRNCVRGNGRDRDHEDHHDAPNERSQRSLKGVAGYRPRHSSTIHSPPRYPRTHGRDAGRDRSGAATRRGRRGLLLRSPSYTLARETLVVSHSAALVPPGSFSGTNRHSTPDCPGPGRLTSRSRPRHRRTRRSTGSGTRCPRIASPPSGARGCPDWHRATPSCAHQASRDP